MQRMILLFLWTGAGLISQAQTDKVSIPLPVSSLKLGYLGAGIHPGVKTGIEIPYKVIQVEKRKRGGPKVHLKQRGISGSLGYYHHQDFHDNVFLLVEQVRRRENTRGWFSEFAPGIGYSRTFLGGTTYQVSAQSEVTRKKMAGFHYALISLSAGGGYNLGIKKDIPLRIYGRIGLMTFFPYNSSIYLRIIPELGVSYSPTKFLKSNPSFKIRKK